MNLWIFKALAFGCLTSAQAFIGNGGTNISHNVPCVGLDGVPISGGPQEAMCCRNGALIANAPAQCRAGFNSITSDAVSGAASSITLAQQTLGVASQLNGVETDLNQVNAPTTGVNTTTSHASPAVHAGMINGGAGADGTFGGWGAMGNGAGAGSASGVAGMAGAALGGGSGGWGTEGAGSTQERDRSGGNDPNAESNKPLGGSFAAAGGDSADGGGFGSGVMSFGTDGLGTGSDRSGSGMEELAYGDESAEGLAESGTGEVEGTIHDPANYFELTNKGDNLFKIVERRYQKKWKKLAQQKKPARVPASGRALQNKPM